MKKFLALSLAIVAALSSFAMAAEDIVINDFEAKDYGDWKVEGKAFGKAPAKGTLDRQQRVSGFEGKQLVNTFLGGDDPKGKLTSPEFTIEREFINLLVGGGNHPGKTCVNLLIDGKVVASATGRNENDGGSEFLNWQTWEVKKYKGKKATIVILDDQGGSWGHINVDQIVQSDKKAKLKAAPANNRRGGRAALPATASELKVTGKYLLVPVGGKQGMLTMMVDDTLVHNVKVDFANSKDKIAWWTYFDMGEYQGKTVKFTAQADPEVIKLFEFSDEIRNLMPLYDEKLRPQFHISQKRGWNNDPNGMVYHDGEWHFFWQCNPGGPNWANMYWGHAVSPDLVHWTELDRALRSGGGRNENKHRSMAVGACFSGSANVDKNNSGGWKTGKEDVIVAAYTDTGCGEALAYSNDRGRTWTQYEGNPVIKHRGRDPKLMWYEPGKHWVIAVYDTKDGNNIAIYTSKDLKEWKLESHIPGYFECAEIFELPIDGDKKNTKWVIFAADAKYAIGKFDGKKFTPEHEGKHQVHWGPYYASQCFSNTPDGRVIQVGWARIAMPGMPFNQTFTLPTNLTLHNTPDGVRMFAYPVKEIETLRKPNPVTVKDKDLEGAISFDAKGDLYDIVVTVKNKDAKKVVLKAGGKQVAYDFGASKLNNMPCRNKDGEVTFRLLIDRPMHEIIGGQGECYQTAKGGSSGEPLGKIELIAEGGTLRVKSLEIFEMNSSWKKKK